MIRLYVKKVKYGIDKNSRQSYLSILELYKKVNQGEIMRKFRNIIVILLLVGIASTLVYYFKTKSKPADKKTPVQASQGNKIEENKTPAAVTLPEKKENKEFTLSFAGDCTLGTDTKFAYSGNFIDVFNKNGKDYSYNFKNVYPIFSKDSLTVVNLEGTFTDADKKAVKTYTFKAPKDYVNILNEGSIEAVNTANNHAFDYLQKGFNDTIASLKGAGVGYFGNGYSYIKEINGVKFGFLGYLGFDYDNSSLAKMKSDIKALKDKDCFVVVTFHWGIERDYHPNGTQKTLAKYAIDNGADLIIGHHPHVLQGLEVYKNRVICYSMGNFSFGGNSNPSDKDTMIAQIKLNYEGSDIKGYSFKVIPCSLSSVSGRNNYQPTPLKGSEKDRVLKKINNLSYNFKVSDQFIKIF